MYSKLLILIHFLSAILAIGLSYMKQTEVYRSNKKKIIKANSLWDQIYHYLACFEYKPVDQFSNPIALLHYQNHSPLGLHLTHRILAIFCWNYRVRIQWWLKLRDKLNKNTSQKFQEKSWRFWQVWYSPSPKIWTTLDSRRS